MLAAKVSADAVYDRDIVREGIAPGLERIGEANDMGQNEQTESKGHVCN